jgi:hypothetical protein
MSAYATGSQESVIAVPEDAWPRQHAQRRLFMAAIDPFHCDRDGWSESPKQPGPVYMLERPKCSTTTGPCTAFRLDGRTL